MFSLIFLIVAVGLMIVRIVFNIPQMDQFIILMYSICVCVMSFEQLKKSKQNTHYVNLLIKRESNFLNCFEKMYLDLICLDLPEDEEQKIRNILSIALKEMTDELERQVFDEANQTSGKGAH